MRLHSFVKSFTLFIAFFLLCRFIAKNDKPQSIVLDQIGRKPVNLSSMYQPDCLDVNTKVCPEDGQDLDLFIAVMSAPDRVRQREAVRGTWGHFAMRRDVEIAFFIGETTYWNWINQLDKEEEIYDDIIRCPLLDEPEVPTLKAVQILEWTKKYCRKAKFLLKTTDDVFINVAKLLQFISKLNPKGRQIYGRVARLWTPIRNMYDPNYVSLDEYKHPVFPDYTIGPSYLIPIHLCEELFLGILRQNFLSSEDILLTGITAESLGIRRIHDELFVNSKLSVSTCNVRRALSLKCFHPIEMFDFWIHVHDLSVKCEKHSNGSEVSYDYVQTSSFQNDPEKIYVMTF